MRNGNFRHFTQMPVILALLPFILQHTMGQTYYDTHVENKLVAENSFIARNADLSPLPVFDQARQLLPKPVWEGHPDAINCYWRAWELAFSNLRLPQPERNGFISPFIDPAFNEHIFMWDSHFMLMFGKYGTRAFNFQGTLDNFYAKQHKDGFICREIKESDGHDFFERFDPSSTGPNLFPWTEWEYFLNFNDTARLKEVFPPLLAYYQWYNTYRTWKDGSYWSSGWGCGMDNQPRLPAGYNDAWSHGHMSWIDITCQQAFVGGLLVEMSQVLGREDDVKDIQTEILSLKQYVNEKMWDQKSAFYYDRYRDGSLSGVKSIGAFWALPAGLVEESRIEPFIAHLEDPAEFARLHRVATLSADHPVFNPDGEYWRGSVWAPTNYMVLRGLTKYGYDSLAFEIALNHLSNVVEVFNGTGTLFENYAPDKVQGNDRKDFVGWTGIVPITVLFEYVFGIRPDVPHNTIIWDINLTDAFGIADYPFGNKGTLSLHCQKRNSPYDEPSIEVKSNTHFTLILKWRGGEKRIEI
ncbi:MAG TPA: trehalase family glycosidase [Lentimicrobium sp.]|nr:trehalase family glycosidase [Lentimicrobium sp.]